MSVWLVIVIAGAGSYLFRVSMLVLAARAAVPAVLERAAGFAVPVAFAALAASGLARHVGDAGTGAVPALAAVAVGVVAVRRTGTSHVALLVGMPTAWLLSAFIP